MMRRMGQLTMLATTSLAVIACQGCIGQATSPDYLVDAAPAVEVSEISQGIVLATSGAFTHDIVFGTSSIDGPVSTAPSFAFGDQEQSGPSLSGQIRVISNEQLIEPQSARFAPIDEKDVLSGTQWSGVDALQEFQANRDAVRMLQPTETDRNFSAQLALGAPRQSTGLALDAAFVPSVAYVQEGEFQTRRYGAELRIGRDFDQRGSAAVADSWYIFAGTEGEALVWEAGEYGMSNVTGAVALRDQVTVGDMQAGISMQRGNGQLSLSFIRREVQWSDRNGGAERNEDFAGVSFTLRQ